VGPEFEKGDGLLRPIASNNASPAQRGPRRDAQPRRKKERKKTDNPREGWEDHATPARVKEHLEEHLEHLECSY